MQNNRRVLGHEVLVTGLEDKGASSPILLPILLFTKRRTSVLQQTWVAIFSKHRLLIRQLNRISVSRARRKREEGAI